MLVVLPCHLICRLVYVNNNNAKLELLRQFSISYFKFSSPTLQNRGGGPVCFISSFFVTPYCQSPNNFNPKRGEIKENLSDFLIRKNPVRKFQRYEELSANKFHYVCSVSSSVLWLWDETTHQAEKPQRLLGGSLVSPYDTILVNSRMMRRIIINCTFPFLLP